MRIPLSRTRARIVHNIKGLVFDKANFQKLLDERRRHQLEDSMGFRGQWDEHRRFQIALLKQQGLLPEHELLEIGCGPLTGGIPIINYLNAGNYVGVDVRDSVLNESWKEIGIEKLSAKNPRLICSSNFADIELGNRKFDFVLSFSVLYHLRDDILARYFSAVAQRLRPSGQCLANVNVDMESSTWLQFPFIKRSIEDYRRAAHHAALAVKVLGTIADLGFGLRGGERKNVMLAFSLKS